MLTEQEQGELSNLALEMAPSQDMWLASVTYRLLCANFEREKDDWFWEDRAWMWYTRDEDKPPLGPVPRQWERTVDWQPPLDHIGV